MRKKPKDRLIISWRIERQLPFLRSILKETNHQPRRERLQLANADHINAISELVMNTLRRQIPVSSTILQRLRPHHNALRDGSSQTFLEKATSDHDGSNGSWPVATVWTWRATTSFKIVETLSLKKITFSSFQYPPYLEFKPFPLPFSSPPFNVDCLSLQQFFCLASNTDKGEEGGGGKEGGLQCER